MFVSLQTLKEKNIQYVPPNLVEVAVGSLDRRDFNVCLLRRKELVSNMRKGQICDCAEDGVVSLFGPDQEQDPAGGVG